MRGWHFPLGLGIFVVFVTHLVAQENGGPAPNYLWLSAPAVVLLLRNRYPLSVFVVVSTLVWGYYATGNADGPMALYGILAVYFLSLRRGPLVAGVTATVVLALGALIIAAGGGDWSDIAFAVGWYGMAIAAGAAVTARRKVMAARIDRAAEQDRRRAEEERLRIAREVHDVVAHSLAMINIQAGVGAHIADRRPEQAKEALLAIKDASHTALADLRSTLAVLRSGDGRTPAPSLCRLTELTEPTTAAGLPVRVEGEPGELPAPVDSAAYRIVQESLTNAVRHGTGATGVTVRFSRTPTALMVQVRDDGTAAPPGTGGNGLRGMRERAEALGGTLTAGAGPDGGFTVRAELPIGAPE